MDEEYFYHAIAIQVVGTHSRMGPIIFEDLKRRTGKPQTPAMVRKLLTEARTTTKAGIVLPRPLVEVSFDLYRLEQVALKIAQCIYHLERGAYLAKANCTQIGLCESLKAVPEFFKLSWAIGPFKGDYPDVFHYCCVEFPSEDWIIVSLLFWESMMACMLFEKP